MQGLSERQDGTIQLISEVISEGLDLPCHVLMGANIANEVAEGQFCEATVGARSRPAGERLKRLFQNNNFRITIAPDAHTVELCGALKNVVACGAGFVDGLGYGDNSKAAVIRLGLMEMTKFIEHFFPGSNLSTFFESCGIADLVTTCYGGRNRRVCEAFVKTGKSIEQLEQEMLNGQRLQGPLTALHVHHMLEKHDMATRFPLFHAIHRICAGSLQPQQMLDCLRNHPEHM